jgi:hypothetical protein
MEETKYEIGSGKLTFTEFVVNYAWLIIVFLYWVANKGKDYVHWDKATVYSGLIILLYILSKTVILSLAEKTPKLVANDLYTTTDGTCYTKGDWTIWTLGDIVVSDIWYHKGTKGAIVVHRSAVNRIGKNVVLTATLIRVPFAELPKEARQKISELKLSPPYYLGLIDEEFELAVPEIKVLEEEIRQTNKLNTFLTDLLEGKEDIIEKRVASADRIRSRAVGGIEKIKSILIPPKE